MMTDELIGRLVDDFGPVPRLSIPRRLFLGLGLGAAASVVLVVGALGVRPDIAEASNTPEFWGKLIYTLVMSVVGLWVTGRVVRPGGAAFWRTTSIIVPLCAVSAAAALQISVNGSSNLDRLMYGSTAPTCPWLVVLCSLGPLAGLIWAARGCAPTRGTVAGAAIGLAAGGMGGALYSLHCTENGMLFLALWYTFGLALVVAIGGAIGSRMLRW